MYLLKKKKKKACTEVHLHSSKVNCIWPSQRRLRTLKETSKILLEDRITMPQVSLTLCNRCPHMQM